MPFQITQESVDVIRQLSIEIPESIDRMYKANEEIQNCYESVLQTVGPHTKDIEQIVRDLRRLLHQTSENMTVVSKKLNYLAQKMETVLNLKPVNDSSGLDNSFHAKRERLLQNLRFSATPLSVNNNASSDDDVEKPPLEQSIYNGR